MMSTAAFAAIDLCVCVCFGIETMMIIEEDAEQTSDAREETISLSETFFECKCHDSPKTAMIGWLDVMETMWDSNADGNPALVAAMTRFHCIVVGTRINRLVTL